MMTMMKMKQPSSSAGKVFLVVGALATTATVDSFSIPMQHQAMSQRRSTTSTSTRLALGVSSSYLDSISSSAAPVMPSVPGATDAYLERLTSLWLSSVEEASEELFEVQQQQDFQLEQLVPPSPPVEFNFVEQFNNNDMEPLSTAFSNSGEDGSSVMSVMADVASSSSSSSAPTESLWDITILEQTGKSIDAATAADSVMEKANAFVADILSQVATKLEGVAADTASALNSAVDGLTHQKVITLLQEFGAFLKQVVYVFLQLLNTFLESLTGMTLNEVSSSLSASITKSVSSTIDATLQTLHDKMDMISNMSVYEFASALLTLLGSVSNLLYSIANAIIKTVSGHTVVEWAQMAAGSAKVLAVNVGEQTWHTVADLGEKSPAELAQGILTFLDTTTQFASEAVGAVSGIVGETTALSGMVSSSVGLSMASFATMSTSLSGMIHM
jgi:hypothetical protein